MGERKKVLIVEDEGLTAMVLESHMAELGYSVVGFSATGEDAVQKAKSEEPDLIFMDVRLAGKMDGLEAARLINADRLTPIIIISGYTDRVRIERDSAFKPAACLSKPIDFNDLNCILQSIT
jgi:CheY-like chemotaxis protein